MTWKAPKGYTLEVHEGYFIDGRGFRVSDEQMDDPKRGLMPDGQIEVLWFNEDEPFVWGENDGRGPHASEEAIAAARAGTPLEGWMAQVESRPIQDGWHPPVYILRKGS
jgi:hypothetical protein